jgi:hypothetical protein
MDRFFFFKFAPPPKKIGLKKRKSKKCLELPDLARKMIRKFQPPPLQTRAPENLPLSLSFARWSLVALVL